MKDCIIKNIFYYYYKKLNFELKWLNFKKGREDPKILIKNLAGEAIFLNKCNIIHYKCLKKINYKVKKLP